MSKLGTAYNAKKRSKIKALKRPSTIPMAEGGKVDKDMSADDHRAAAKAHRHTVGMAKELGLTNKVKKQLEDLAAEHEKHAESKSEKLADGGKVQKGMGHLTRNARLRQQEAQPDDQLAAKEGFKKAMQEAGHKNTSVNFIRAKYAEGGTVKSKRIDSPRMTESSIIKPKKRHPEDKHEFERGVHTPSYSNENDLGRSEAGDAVRQAPRNDTSFGRSLIRGAKADHKQKLKELREMPKPNLMAEGGEVDIDSDHDDMVSAIMARRQRLHDEIDAGHHDVEHAMAEGGDVVDIMENGEEQPNDFDDINEAALKENYDSDMEHVDQPMDSNEIGDEREDEESDPHDMVDSIRKKVIKKRKA